MENETISKVFSEFCGNDNSPGSLTWDEAERLTGLSADEIRTSCTVTLADAERLADGLADDETDELHVRLGSEWQRQLLASV